MLCNTPKTERTTLLIITFTSQFLHYNHNNKKTTAEQLQLRVIKPNMSWIGAHDKKKIQTNSSS